MRIGEILKTQGHLTDEDIETILKRQVVHGGRFGTCAVEVKRLDLDIIAAALSEQSTLPAATARHFARADQTVMRRLDAALAAGHRVIPLGYLKRDPDEIAVACLDPLSDESLSVLGDVLGAALVPAIAPELRMLYFLETVYGIERMARFRRSPSTDQNQPDIHERRSYIKTLSDADSIEPPAPLARIAVRRIVVNAEAKPRLDTVSGGVRAIRRATGRDRVGDYVVGTLENAFDNIRCGIIFAARDEILLGWKGFVRDSDSSRIESVALEISHPSMLRDPFIAGVPYFGEPPRHSLDERLWAVLGLEPPAEIAVVPVVLRREVVALIYADAAAPMEAAEVGGLAELGQALAAAFDRLVKAAER